MTKRKSKKEKSQHTRRRKGINRHISRGSYLVDILFRSRKYHSNHGRDFTDSLKDITGLIRKDYNSEVPIIAVCDSGFLDGKSFAYFEEYLKLGYVEKIPLNERKKFKVNGVWNCVGFGNKLKNRNKFRRAIFTAFETEENGKLILEFAKPDTIFYTNIGQNAKFVVQLKKAGREDLLTADAIISLAHHRGKDEFIHRSIKELATKERLPFKRMGMNGAYYYLLAITHFLFDSYKRDVTKEVFPIESYPNTFHRELINFAVKIVSHSGMIILKDTKKVKDRLDIDNFWKLCQSPPLLVMR